MNKTINLGDLVIPLIKPEKGVDYYTDAEKQELITTVTNNVNEIVLPQEQTRQSNELSRQTNETTRQSQETTRQTNEVNRQNAENARQTSETARQDAESIRASAETARQGNESSRVLAEQQRVQTFNTEMDAVDNAIEGIHTSQEAYDQNAQAKTVAFNTNATNKTNDFNDNATSKTTTFNNNVTSKTTTFNENATDKTTTFNNNATSKTEDFNTNAETKTQEFDENAESYGNRITALEIENADLKEQLKDRQNNELKGTVSGTEIDLSDSADSRVNEIGLSGNSEQETTEGKNKLKNTASSQTISGVTFTVNSDGSVTANGTATANTSFYVFGAAAPSNRKKLNIENGSYILNGCPSGGSGSTYRFAVIYTEGSDDYKYTADYGSGVNFDYIGQKVGVYCEVRNGYTANNLIFKPMLRLATETDSTYEPYTNGASPNPDYEQPIKSCGDNVNLFDLSKRIYTSVAPQSVSVSLSNGVLSASTNSGTAHSAYLIGNLKVGQKYTISWENATNLNSMQLSQSDSSGTQSTQIFRNYNATDSATFEAPTEYVLLNILASTTTLSIKQVQLVKGDKAKTYNPYGNGMGCITEKIVNKNKYDKQYSPYYNGTGLTVTNIDKGVYKISGTNTNTELRFISYYNDNTPHWILPEGTYNLYAWINDIPTVVQITRASGNNNNAVNTNFTINSTYTGISSIRVSIPAGTYNNAILKLMLVNSAEDNTYQPYQEQTYTIPTQQPMRSIGTTRDLFFKNTTDSPYYNSSLVENKWYEKHNIWKIILDGTQEMVYVNNHRFDIGASNFTAQTMPKIPGSNGTKSGLLCDRFIEITPDESWSRKEGVTYSSTSSLGLSIACNSIATTVNDFANYLKTNNITIDYILQIPTYLLCTDEQVQALEAYSKARTYKNVTHIYSEDEVPGYVDMTYYRDLETVINNLTTRVEVIESEV